MLLSWAPTTPFSVYFSTRSSSRTVSHITPRKEKHGKTNDRWMVVFFPALSHHPSWPPMLGPLPEGERDIPNICLLLARCLLRWRYHSAATWTENEKKVTFHAGCSVPFLFLPRVLSLLDSLNLFLPFFAPANPEPNRKATWTLKRVWKRWRHVTEWRFFFFCRWPTAWWLPGEIVP